MIGIPDGGSGGQGGDVYFRATARLSSLYDLRRAHFQGNNGKAGRVSLILEFSKKCKTILTVQKS
jgi:GTPase involved in cell partitioning and DNA repair